MNGLREPTDARDDYLLHDDLYKKYTNDVKLLCNNCNKNFNLDVLLLLMDFSKMTCQYHTIDDIIVFLLDKNLNCACYDNNKLKIFFLSDEVKERINSYSKLKKMYNDIMIIYRNGISKLPINKSYGDLYLQYDDALKEYNLKYGL
jgi:hypothetical protein